MGPALLILLLVASIPKSLSSSILGNEPLNIIHKVKETTTPYPYNHADYGQVNQKGNLTHSQAHTFSGLNHYYDSKEHCYFSISNGVLTLTGDVTTAVVSNLGRNYTVNRLDSYSYKFYGVVIVSTPSCTATMLGASFCERSYNYHNLYDDECKIVTHHKLTWLVCVLSLLTISSYLACRFIIVRLLSSDRDYKIVGLDGTLFRFTKVLDYKQSRSVLSYVNPSDKIASKDFPKRYHQSYTPKLLIIAILLFSHPNIAVQAELSTKVDNILMSEGDIVDYDVGQVILRKAREIFPLVHEYQTADYDIEIEQDWHCFTDDCNSHGECSGFGPSGKFTSDKFERVESQLTYLSITKRFCQIGTSGCLFSKGCNKWAVSYRIIESELSSVYRMGQSVEDIDVEIIDDRDLQPISSNLNNKFNTEDLTIVHHYSGLYFICPFPPRKGSPRAGSMGDVQINKDKYGSIAADALSCHTNGLVPVSCDSARSFSQNIPHVCKPFPTSIGSFSLDVVNGTVIAKKPGNVMMHVIRPLTSELKWNPDSCTINYKEVIDIDSGFFSTIIVLRATVAKTQSSKSFHLPCMDNHIMVPCDGKLHKYEIPSLRECTITDPSIKMVKLTNNDMAYYHAEVVRSQESYPDSTSWFDHLLHITPLTLTSFGTFLVILTVIIVVKAIICR